MEVVLVITLSLLSISFHELGHAYATWRRGVFIKRISFLGVPLPIIPGLKVKVRIRKGHEPTWLEMHPFVIGAFVEPAEGELEKLSTKDRALIYGAGPHASFLYTAVMFAIAALLTGPTGFIPGLLWLVGAVVLCLLYEPACRYLVLLTGIVLLVLVVRVFIIAPEVASEGMGGPVTIYEYGKVSFQEEHHASLAGAFSVAGLVSYFIGTTNTLPLVPLDGGQIARIYLTAFKPKLASYYTAGSLVILLGIVGLALTNDFGLLFR